MTDKHVDDLLDDLDRALDVKVSTSVAEAVRTEMAQAPRSRWFGMRWHVAAAAAVAAGFVMAVSYGAWNSAPLAEPPSVVAAKVPGTADRGPGTGDRGPSTADRGPGTAKAAAPRVQMIRAQPELDTTPLISSDGRLAMMQMYAAFKNRVSVEFGNAVSDQIEPVVIPPSVAIEPVSIHMVPPIDGTDKERSW